MFFIRPSQLPAGLKATYIKIIVSYHLQKNDPYQIRFTAGGDRLDYGGLCLSPAAEIQTAKCMLDLVISTVSAHFSALNLKKLYLGTPMPRYKYMWIPC